eukprot:2359965-Lingulodinium_polyedra.AAC.1
MLSIWPGMGCPVAADTAPSPQAPRRLSAKHHAKPSPKQLQPQSAQSPAQAGGGPDAAAGSSSSTAGVASKVRGRPKEDIFRRCER